MSSISALWGFSAGLPIRQLGEQMVCEPGDRLLWFDREIALGGTRPDSLPEDRFDRQPLWAPDGSACMVADARLDNRDDLARELRINRPDELADSEFLLQCWLRWGPVCLDHMVGAFAFAVWVPSRRELFAARDHTGQRPLFFHRGKDFFALASMPKGLLALPGISAEPDEKRLVDWMSGAAPDKNRSAFRDIERVPPAHFLRVRPDGVECTSYWRPWEAKPIRFARDGEYAEAFAEVMDRATAPRLRSTGKIGAQLSSGLDSSTVAASAARLLANSGTRLTVFTSVPQAGFLGKGLPGRLVYEAPGAAEVARRHRNMDHVLVDSAAYDLLAEIETWTDALDEVPTNAVNFLWVSAILDEARRRGVRVMLEGVFGNMTISQEGRENLQTFLRRGKWWRLSRLARTLQREGDQSSRQLLFQATNGLLPLALKRRLRPGLNAMRLDFCALHPDLMTKYRVLEQARAEAHDDWPDARTRRKGFFERYDFGPMNAATAARYGIEPRDPTGDKRVFEFCFGIPEEQYVVGNQSRSLVRRGMRGRLPESTLKRYLRGQQGVDWYLTIGKALPSLREELRRQENSVLARRFVDLARLKGLLDSFPSEGFESRHVSDGWNLALTRGIALGYFLRVHESSR